MQTLNEESTTCTRLHSFYSMLHSLGYASLCSTDGYIACQVQHGKTQMALVGDFESLAAILKFLQDVLALDTVWGVALCR